MKKLPLKISILKAIVQHGPVSATGVLKMLESEYGGERQFTARSVENHIFSFCAVGIVVEKRKPDEEKTLYEVKDAGKAALRNAFGNRVCP
jgi:hypothetical protein